MDPIAITGAGVICAVGRNRAEFVGALRDGTPGIGPVTDLDLGWLPTKLGGEVTTVDPFAEVGSDPSTMTRADAFAVLAAREALEQSGLDLASIAPGRAAVSIGTCQGDIAEVADFVRRRGGSGGVGPLRRSSADVVADDLGVIGERLVVSNACAAGAAAIAAVVEKLLHGDIDVAIVGGTDELAFFTFAGFTVLQSLDPEPCAPYSRSTGLTVGEGAGILVLERAADAAARGRPPTAALLGFGISADGYHPTAPDPTGRRAALAMTRALRVASLEPDDVDYVNGHGTGTPANDAMERKALRAVFGPRYRQVPMSSTKSIIGHLLGAAGAVEAIAAVTAVEHGFLPPTLNVAAPEDLDIDPVPNQARPAPVRVAISTNYAFGGSNVALVVGHAAAARATPRPAPRPVLLSGIGVAGAAGIGLDAWRAHLATSAPTFAEVASPTWGGRPLVASAPPALSARGMAPPDQWRKMDDLARLAMASARTAWDDAGLGALSTQEKDDVGVIFATACGSLDRSLRFEAAARQGPGQANAKDFPHTSMNSAAGHICTVLGLHGPMLSVSNGGVAGLSAVSFASDLVRFGHADRVLVTAIEQLSQEVMDIVRSMGYPVSATGARPFARDADGISPGCSAVTLVFEAQEAVGARGGRGYAELLHTSIGGMSGGAAFDTEAWTRAYDEVTDRSGLDLGDGQLYVATAANGTPESDRAEADAIAKVLASTARVGAPKSIYGECLASSGPVNIVAAALALHDGVLTPVLGLGQAVADLDYVRQTTNARVEAAIASAISPGSSVGCAILARPADAREA